MFRLFAVTCLMLATVATVICSQTFATPLPGEEVGEAVAAELVGGACGNPTGAKCGNSGYGACTGTTVGCLGGGTVGCNLICGTCNSYCGIWACSNGSCFTN